jgi:hypothetical protein
MDLERDDIATAKLTVDGKIEQSKVPNSTLDLELCSDRPNVLGAERRLRPNDLSLVPRNSLTDCDDARRFGHSDPPHLGEGSLSTLSF